MYFGISLEENSLIAFYKLRLNKPEFLKEFNKLVNKHYTLEEIDNLKQKTS